MRSAPNERKAVLADIQRPSTDAVAANRSTDPATRLRAAREARGLSHRFLADATKLPVRTIEALENGRIAKLPGGIYRRAIIRTVAAEVGLDPDELLRDFTIAHPADLTSPASAAAIHPEPPASYSLQKAMAFAGAIVPMLAGLAYFGWPARDADVTPIVENVRGSTDLRPEILPAGGFAEASSTLSAPVVVTLTISTRCGLRIVADGHDLLDRTVQQGESLAIELGEELLLLGDNAAAVQFSINGQAGRPLGAAGEDLSVRIGRDDYEDFLVRY
jgi:cytoskeletal protein RodZ